ncbi:MAG TPA: tape measure protein [Anaerolineales bacterium]|nr:tape measure protein [Anaerolineales bacterium]
MASIADLNVRLGLIYKDLDKGLREAEKSLKRSGNSLSAAGDKLTLALSAPLLGIGAAAVKAAGDMEALRLAMRATFEGAGRGIQQADAELEALREAAKAPGLDFEQAVRGSIRLQNVGFSAEKARGIIQQLANTIATTGGTADDLNEVTNQFSQMIGKGKIFQDDLKIITGRMPKLAQIMRETFGTTTAEGLNALGIDARTFIDTVTKEMEKMPRVTGGIANAIVNAGSAIRLFLAGVGESLDKTFNVTGKLEAFAGFLEGAAKSFAEMDDGTRRMAAGVAVFALALGPAIKAGNLLIQGWELGRIALLRLNATMQAWLLLSSNPEGKTGLISWFTKLDRATKLTTIGALVGVALAAAAAFALLAKNTSATALAAESVAKVQRDAAAAVQEEKVKVTELAKVIKDQNATYDQRKTAIEQLKAISPEYFGSLSAEKTNYEQLDLAIGNYVQHLVDAETVRKAIARKAEIDIERQNVALTTTTTIWQDIGNAILSGGNSMLAAANNAKSFGNNVAETTERLDAEEKGLDDLIGKIGVLKAIPPVPPPVVPPGDDVAKKLKTYKEVLSDIANVADRQDLLGAEKLTEQAQAIEKGVLRLLDAGFQKTSKEVQGLKDKMKDLFKEVGLPTKPEAGVTSGVAPTIDTLPTPEQVNPLGPQFGGATDNFKDIAESVQIATDKLVAFKSVAQELGEVNKNFQGGLASFNETFKATSEIVAENGTLMQQAILGAAAAMQEAAVQGDASFKSLAAAAIGAAGQIVKAWIQQGVAAAVAKALSSIPFPFNLAAGAAAGAIAATLFSKALGALKVPGFAKGTNFSPEGMALVGERGPEIVNLRRGSQIVPNHKINSFMGGGYSDGGGRLVAVVKGSDLLFIVERAQAQAKRVRGF